MNRFLIFFFPLLWSYSSLCAQQDIPDKSRFRFAESTLGISLLSSTGGHSTFLDAQGQVQTFNFGTRVYPILHLGGMHFWNSTELFFSLPFGQLFAKDISETQRLFTQLSDVFGVKYYPWKLNTQKIRPYIGLAISGYSHHQISSLENKSGVNTTKIVYPIQFGVSWSRKKDILELSAKYNFQNRFSYYISKTDETQVTAPALYLGFTYKFKLEGTAANEEYYYSGKEDRDYQALKTRNALNSIYVGLGPSLAFFLHRDTYNKTFFPYLDGHVHTQTFLDLTAGYFHEPTNGYLGLAYRNTSSRLSAFGTEQEIARSSFLLEFNKFLLDYQGFVPFVGVGLSYERLQFLQVESGTIQHELKPHTFAPSINLGWDILPTRLEYITLRTNLRYFPRLRTEVNGHVIHVDQLEFNIIQLVFYPQRFRRIRKMGK